MNSSIFKAASHIISGMMVIFSIYLLLRGHNHPGGGFIAGLIAVIAFALLMLAETPHYVYQKLFVSPPAIACTGLVITIIAGAAPLFLKKAFLSGLWLTDTALGSPLLFDLGIFLAVFGSVLSVLLKVEEKLS